LVPPWTKAGEGVDFKWVLVNMPSYSNVPHEDCFQTANPAVPPPTIHSLEQDSGRRVGHVIAVELDDGVGMTAEPSLHAF